jgi:hypothetical protein
MASRLSNKQLNDYSPQTMLKNAPTTTTTKQTQNHNANLKQNPKNNRPEILCKQNTYNNQKRNLKKALLLVRN